MLGHHPVSDQPVSSIAPFTAASGAASPQRLWLWKTSAVLAIGLFAADDSRAVNQNTLHAFRSPPAAAASGMVPHAIKQLVLVSGEHDAVRVNHASRLMFGRSATVVATSGAPWYLWQKSDRTQEPEVYIPRRGADLHRFRTGYQTVGQSYRLWPRVQTRIESEEYATAKPVDLTAFRNSQPLFSVAGQPFFIWPKIKVDVTDAEDGRRVNHQSLHQYRVGYQTVGQSWQYWIKPQQRIDAEEYSVPPPASIFPYRQVTVAAPLGQPWFMWPRAVADQSLEPNPRVTDHAAALYPFLPHPAITPVPAVDGGGRGGDDRRPYARRHKGFNLEEWKKEHRYNRDIEETLKTVWAQIKGEAPEPVFQEAAKVVLQATPKTIKARREVDWPKFSEEWSNVYRLMEVYDEWQREEDDINFLLLNG